MIRPLSLVCALLAGALAGCAPKPVPPSQSAAVLTSQAQLGGLAEGLEINHATLRWGQTLRVTLTARNTGDKPIEVYATNSAKMLVTLWRYARGVGYERYRQFPESFIRLHGTWTLGPGEQRVFHMDLTVAPDWPTSERMLLTAELNGRPDVRPSVMIEVEPASPASQE